MPKQHGSDLQMSGMADSIVRLAVRRNGTAKHAVQGYSKRLKGLANARTLHDHAHSYVRLALLSPPSMAA